jgi:hypothetical protein
MASLSKPSRRSDVRRANYGRRNSMTMKVDMQSVNALLHELKGDILKAVRPAAQAAAEVMYRAVLQNVDAMGSKTGNLRAGIYQVFSKDQSKAAGDGYSRATYHVSWNAKIAPHGHLVEYGHLQRYQVYLGKDGNWYTNKKAPLPAPKQVAARPFVRPAFNRQDQAVAAADAKLLELLGT